jgi:hypothetical protein
MRYEMDLNFEEVKKDWEDGFYESDWEPDTLNYTDTEKKIIQELTTFLPRHSPVYDWNLPYADEILLIFRRHLSEAQKDKGGQAETRVSQAVSQAVQTAGQYTDPKTLPKDIKVKLLIIRDELTAGDYSEAWHHLYSIASPNFDKTEPWKDLEDE